MNRTLALALAIMLGASAAFGAGTQIDLVVPPGGVKLQGTADGSARTFTANPSAGVAFYAASAMGPVSLRENFAGFSSGSGVGLGPASAHWADSTVIIPTLGAKRIEVWLYAFHDSLTSVISPSGVDSAKVVVFAVLPKAHLTPSLADSGNSAYWQGLRSSTTGDSLALWGKRITGDFGSLIPGYLTTATRTTSAGSATTPAATVSAVNALLPGEFVVPYVRNFVLNQGLGNGAVWTKFDICTSDGGCFTSEYISLRVRVLGHATVWPAVGLVARFENRFAVRLDVKGYYQ